MKIPLGLISQILLVNCDTELSVNKWEVNSKHSLFLQSLRKCFLKIRWIYY